MPPLKNKKDELLAQTYVNDPEVRFNKKQTYLKAIPTVKENSAGVLGTRALNKVSVQNRIAELLNSQGLTLEKFNGKLGELLEAKSEDVQFKSTRLGYELHGVLNREKDGAESSKDILIQVNIMGSNGQNESVTV